MKTDRKSAITASTQRVCIDPLTCHMAKFAEFLAGEGYVSQTIKTKCVLVVELSRWLKRRRLPREKLDEERLRQFHAIRRASITRGDVSTGHQLLAFLLRLGIIPPLPPKMDQT